MEEVVLLEERSSIGFRARKVFKFILEIICSVVFESPASVWMM